MYSRSPPPRYLCYCSRIYYNINEKCEEVMIDFSKSYMVDIFQDISPILRIFNRFFLKKYLFLFKLIILYLQKYMINCFLYYYCYCYFYNCLSFLKYNKPHLTGSCGAYEFLVYNIIIIRYIFILI
jgi:hypothetical protein